jgi:AraC-like DNA-binding protein
VPRVVVVQDSQGEYVYGLPVLVRADRDRFEAAPYRLRQHEPALVTTGTEDRHPHDGNGKRVAVGPEMRRRLGVMLPALLDVLLVQILRAWLASRNGDAPRWAVALHDPAVGSALRAIHTQPDRSWTVGELGTRVGLSRAVFARRFTALVGQPPLAYLSWWRMTVAARLLREGDAPMAAIARRVGYASQYAFAHAFKRAFGSPPGAFRRAMASPDPPAQVRRVQRSRRHCHP